MGEMEEIMVGVIITGHGKYATGIETNVKLLVGKETRISSVDFEESDSVEVFEKNLSAALESAEDCGHKIVFCDVIGGTPFNKSVMLTADKNDTRVIYGTNVGMVVELCMKNLLGERIEDIDQLVVKLLQLGKEQIGTFIRNDETVNDSEDGI